LTENSGESTALKNFAMLGQTDEHQKFLTGEED
jgi:hypothetical protein